MPSAYTDKISKNTTFKEFALDCSKAFIREHPANSKDIERHYLERIKKAQLELHMLEASSSIELGNVYSKAIKENKDAFDKREAARKEMLFRYEKMLSCVKAWKCPTQDHKPLKKFMITQIEDSIRVDCSKWPFEPIEGTCLDYIERKKKVLSSDIEFYNSLREKALKNWEIADTYLTQLSESLDIETE